MDAFGFGRSRDIGFACVGNPFVGAFLADKAIAFIGAGFPMVGIIAGIGFAVVEVGGDIAGLDDGEIDFLGVDGG